jgi:hypothetical protein
MEFLSFNPMGNNFLLIKEERTSKKIKDWFWNSFSLLDVSKGKFEKLLGARI